MSNEIAINITATEIAEEMHRKAKDATDAEAIKRGIIARAAAPATDKAMQALAASARDHVAKRFGQLDTKIDGVDASVELLARDETVTASLSRQLADQGNGKLSAAESANVEGLVEQIASHMKTRGLFPKGGGGGASIPATAMAIPKGSPAPTTPVVKVGKGIDLSLQTVRSVITAQGTRTIPFLTGPGGIGKSHDSEKVMMDWVTDPALFATVGFTVDTRPIHLFGSVSPAIGSGKMVFRQGLLSRIFLKYIDAHIEWARKGYPVGEQPQYAMLLDEINLAKQCYTSLMTATGNDLMRCPIEEAARCGYEPAVKALADGVKPRKFACFVWSSDLAVEQANGTAIGMVFALPIVHGLHVATGNDGPGFSASRGKIDPAFLSRMSRSCIVWDEDAATKASASILAKWGIGDAKPDDAKAFAKAMTWTRTPISSTGVGNTLIDVQNNGSLNYRYLASACERAPNHAALDGGRTTVCVKDVAFLLWQDVVNNLGGYAVATDAAQRGQLIEEGVVKKGAPFSRWLKGNGDTANPDVLVK